MVGVQVGVAYGLYNDSPVGAFEGALYDAAEGLLLGSPICDLLGLLQGTWRDFIRDALWISRGY